jgi:succinoglycan biosynthesis protein ExoA
MHQPLHQPLVSIVIPALNEARDIAGCIEAIGKQDYPLCALEVILVDGSSEDATIAVAESAAREIGFARFVIAANPLRGRSDGLNIGLREARGSYLLRIDARSRVESHYVTTCVDLLAANPEVGEVGGAQIALPRSGDSREIGLARAQRNRLTSGFSRYRRSTVSGPAEHVWMGAFRTDELRAIGGWDPAIFVSEDFELSQRYVGSGRVVWFDSRLRSGYLARPTLRLIARQHYAFGVAKGTWWARGGRPVPRQVVLLALPPIAVAGAVISARAIGWPATAAVAAAAALGVEAVGCSGPEGGAGARAISMVSVATYSLSWWTGAIAGYVGEKAGVEHRHA